MGLVYWDRPVAIAGVFSAKVALAPPGQNEFSTLQTIQPITASFATLYINTHLKNALYRFPELKSFSLCSVKCILCPVFLCKMAKTKLMTTACSEEACSVSSEGKVGVLRACTEKLLCSA